MSPIERAARALPHMLGPYSFDELPTDRAGLRALRRVGDHYEHTQADMLDLARAVLQAIREPSEAMLNADGGEDPRWDDIFLRNAWRAMIDAALTE